MTKARRYVDTFLPHMIGPCLPVRGDFTRFEWPAPMAIWSVAALRLAAEHGCTPEHRAAAAAELQTRNA